MGLNEGALDRRGLAVLASGHACADMAQGAVPALLPFLIDQRGLSYGAAARAHPRHERRLVGHPAALRPGLRSPRAAVAHAPRRAAWPAWAWRSSGSRSSYPATAAAVAISGLGVAAFHPEGARFANHVVGRAPRAGHELLLAGRQRRLRAGPDPRHPARPPPRACAGRCCSPCSPTIVALVIARELGRLRARGRREVRARRARRRRRTIATPTTGPPSCASAASSRCARASTSACRPSCPSGSSTTSAPARAPATRR